MHQRMKNPKRDNDYRISYVRRGAEKLSTICWRDSGPDEEFQRKEYAAYDVNDPKRPRDGRVGVHVCFGVKASLVVYCCLWFT